MFWGVISVLSTVVCALLSSSAPQASSTGGVSMKNGSPGQSAWQSPVTANTGGTKTPTAREPQANAPARAQRQIGGCNAGSRAGRVRAAAGGAADSVQTPVASSHAARFVTDPAALGAPLYTFDTSVGSAAPPGTLGGYIMTGFGPDPSPLLTDVSSVTDPCDGSGAISFSHGMNHRRIGSGWMDWSHGYTGDIYYSNGALSVTITLSPAIPPGCAFYFYTEPNPFSVQSFTVTGYDGGSTSFTADGSGGAAFCGVLGPVEALTIECTTGNDFAIGEFGVACTCCVPCERACCYEAVEPAYCIEQDIMECVAAGGRWDVDAQLCSELDPPCGEYLGACCYGPDADPGYEPYQCIGDMTQSDCLYLSEYTNWTGGESCDDPLFLCPGAPHYCDASGGCDEYIARVQMAGDPGIDNSSGCSQYADYTTIWTLVVPGAEYPITVTNGTAYSADLCSIWVDWNQDKTFEDEGPEWIGDVVGGGISPPYSMTLAVPGDYVPGYTRMRIRIDYSNPDPDPCGTTTYGEVEDYSLMVGDVEGACCNIHDGSCQDDVLASACAETGGQFHYAETCDTMDPPCGDPGCCCDEMEPGWQSAHPEYRANCDGRFLSGVLGEDCVASAFVPECGTPYVVSVLYAPSWNDNPGFRAALSALLMSPVDYWNSYTQGTPPLETMMEYAAVVTWVNYSYGDAVGMGNTLADFVDLGGRVMLGQWCRQSDQSSYLQGRIMSDPAYCPVLACSTSFGSGAYNLDGVLCPHDGPEGVVGYHDTQYLDVITTVTETARTDGTIGSGGDTSISAVWSANCQVWYCAGFTATDYGSGDWVTKIANMVICQCLPGACCNLTTAECIDEVAPLDCQAMGSDWRPYSGLCVDLIPPCGDPGACCDLQTGACIDDVLRANCLAVGHQASPGAACCELDPPCGDPGCCCERPETGEPKDPVFAFRANCQGRFIPGAFTLCGDFDESGVVDMTDYGMFLDAFGKCSGDPGYMAAADMDNDGCISLADFQTWRNCYQFQGTDCTAQAFTPECGQWAPTGMLYAPSWNDSPSFCAALEAMIGRVDYWDAYHDGTPSLELLRQYATVMTWCNYPYADPVAMGDVLADYVDEGGTVILGQWCRHGTQSNYLQGRIMDNPAYCPVLTISDSFCQGEYNMDGVLFPHVGAHGVVGAHGTSYLDVVSSLAPGAQTDGTIGSGGCLSFDAIWSRTGRVLYSPGNLGGEPGYTTGDWVSLTANMTYSPPCGACCYRDTYADPADPWLGGECIETADMLECFYSGGQYHFASCELLDPVCGNPGACCDDATAVCEVMLQALCNEGRFHSGLACEDLPTACGYWAPSGLVYMPTNSDNSGFRTAVAGLLNGAPVDYFDPRTVVPGMADIEEYAVVFTWVNYPYADNVATGDLLADYVDAGGRVILGQWCLPTASNYLAGRIMTAEYCPAIASSYTTNVTYAGDGLTTPFLSPYAVTTLTAQYADVISAVRPGATADGHWASGGICVAYWPSFRVYYCSGHTGTQFSAGDWVRLTANMLLSVPQGSACCNRATGECQDDIEFFACREMGPEYRPHPGVLCDELIPACGNPGACCNIYTGECLDEVLEYNCANEFHPGYACGELDPPCGDPGCCCDYPEPGQPTEPHFDYAANCSGRFVSGVLGENCVGETFEPECGLQLISVHTDPGTGAPSPDLCGQTMTPFAPDPRPYFADVTTLPTPCTIPGEIGISPSVNHRRIGSGWMSWSHGYTGDVYLSNGAASVTMAMPIATEAVYFYVEPNPFAVHTFQVLVNGTYLSDPFTADGSAGAAYVGVCGTPVETIVLTDVSMSPADFAVGEFAIACIDVPGACCDEPGEVCTEGVMASACVAIPGYRFSPDPATCAEFEPPCGQIHGACCYEETCAYERPSECGGEYRGDGVPCDPNPCLCWDAEMTAPGTWTGTTVGAGDDCALRTGQDVIIKVEVPTGGNWQFDVCASSPGWDTYMFLGTECCQSTWSNDDGCVAYSMLSIIRRPALPAGTYYVDIEPYGSTTTGPVVLTVANYDPADRSLPRGNAAQRENSGAGNDVAPHENAAPRALERLCPGIGKR